MDEPELELHNEIPVPGIRTGIAMLKFLVQASYRPVPVIAYRLCSARSLQLSNFRMITRLNDNILHTHSTNIFTSSTPSSKSWLFNIQDLSLTHYCFSNTQYPKKVSKSWWIRRWLTTGNAFSVQKKMAWTHFCFFQAKLHVLNKNSSTVVQSWMLHKKK